MLIKQLLIEFAQSVSEKTFSRNTLLEYCTSKCDLSKVIELIESSAEQAVIASGPTMYDTEKFIECMETGTSNENVDFSAERTSNNKVEFSIIDGRNDPNQPNIIKTKSYRDLEEILHPDYPLNIYISGETGLGKTTAVIAIAKQIGIPVVRVNLSGATDLDDLLGGIRIADGNTIFDPGPVAIAMEMGAILLLDEVDAGNPKILIDLHPVLEKKGVLLKKGRKMLYPTRGFRVIATGNSKGQGDATGKYIGVAPLNHAFMQRFGAGIDFKPPNEAEMAMILKDTAPMLHPNVRLNLAKWFAHVHTSFENGAISDYVHVRKMNDIAITCLIYGAQTCGDSAVPKAIKRAMNLYDEALVESFVALYGTIKDPSLGEATEAELLVATKADEPAKIDENGIQIPF
jgi:hypothetical protein